MKRLLRILALLWAFGFTTVSIVQNAPTIEKKSSIVQETLMEINNSFCVIIDHAGKEQQVPVDESTIIIGKVQPGVQGKTQMTKDGQASAVMIAGS